MSKKIVSLGGLNLTFFLELSDYDINKYSIVWDEIKTLKDLYFIQENSDLRDKIEIKSNDETINFFLYINKVNKNKIYIQYITLNEIFYNEEQKDFRNFIQQITGSNFLFISSKKIFNSINNEINMELIYKNDKKIFNLTSSSNDEENSKKIFSLTNMINNNEENESNIIKDEENNFIKLSMNKNIFKYFDYLFLDYKKIKEELNSIIKEQTWYLFCLNLKKNFRINIISYMENFSLNSEEKKFFKIIDIFIFPDKNKAQNIINDLKQKEEYTNQVNDTKSIIERNKTLDHMKEREYIKGKIFSKKNNKSQKLYQNSSLFSKIKNSSNISSLEKNSKIIYRNNSNALNNISKISHSYNKPINIKSTLIYFKKYTLASEDKNFLFENKILIFLNVFNEIIFCIFNKREKNPFIYNFKFRLFPEINVHNIEEINNYKNIVKKNFEIYSLIFLSCILSIIIQENIDEDHTCVKAFLFGNNCIKNLIEYEKQYNIFPKNKNIFLTKINKDDISNFNYKPKSEIKFVLDGGDVTKKKILYNPLLDKYSKTYFCSEESRKVIRKNGLIDEKGNIIYDQTYKDSLGINPKYANNKYLTEKDLNKEIYSMNILKDIKNKKTESLNKIIKNKYTLNKKIIGYNQKAYQYSIYYNALKKRILPHINSKSRNIIDKNKTYKSYGVKIKLKPTLQTEI